MPTNITINGMSRIGRMVLRIVLHNENSNMVAINTSYPPETTAYLINYDTMHGRHDKEVEPIEDGIRVGNHNIRLVSDRNPENLSWKDLSIDIVIEATEKSNHDDKAVGHIHTGAKKVLLTGPSKDGEVQMIVEGVNDDKLDVEKYDIFSSTSCTTNCIGPVAKVLNDQFGIVNGLMTTVHAITNDQKNIDNPHKDLRRACSCNESIIPISTGAAKALKEVLPELEGKLHGLALRVPMKNVSLVGLIIDLEKPVTVDEINNALRHSDLDDVLEVENAPLVSVDFNTNPHSAIVDTENTIVIDDHKVKVIAWYDNEWGYSSRIVEIVEMIGEQLVEKSIVTAV